MHPVNFSSNGIDKVQTSFYTEGDAYYFFTELDVYTIMKNKKLILIKQVTDCHSQCSVFDIFNYIQKQCGHRHVTGNIFNSSARNIQPT